MFNERQNADLIERCCQQIERACRQHLEPLLLAAVVTVNDHRSIGAMNLGFGQHGLPRPAVKEPWAYDSGAVAVQRARFADRMCLPQVCAFPENCFETVRYPAVSSYEQDRRLLIHGPSVLPLQ